MGVEVAVSVGVDVPVRVGVEVYQVPVDVGVKVLEEGCGMIWIAATMALFTLAGPNWIVITPPDGAMLLNTSSRAMFAPPAAAKTSKLVRTVVPLIDTLKALSPEAVK